MRKTDKKLDNEIRRVLTEVCEIALEEVDGFQWLTHMVNYSRFPESLRITCVFETQGQLKRFIEDDMLRQNLEVLIINKLQELNVHFKKNENHIRFDSEELCEREHNSNWAKRLGTSA